MRTLSVFAYVQNIIRSIQSGCHVIGVQNCLTSGQLQSRFPKHLNVHPRNRKDCCGSKRSSCNSTPFLWDAQFVSTKLSGCFGIGYVSWQERSKMCGDTDRSDTWSTSSMRDAESFMKIQVAHVGADQTRAGQAHLGVHVCTIHVNLATCLVDGVHNFNDTLLKHSKGRRIGHHEGSEIVSMLLDLGVQILDIDISLVVIVDNNDLHPGHHGTGRVCSVSTLRDQTDVSVPFTLGFKVVFDR
mmetsp:Transcript_12932/g.26793  ORF Transcript_12932/g.26793 Transcript_12932/m.26793 type:complete len:242 (+) Transcript_12932:474-1199(+)